MKKPVKKPKKKNHNDPAYDWHELEEFIRTKTGRELENWLGHRYDGTTEEQGNPPYCNFWHWICDNNEIHNGCYFTIWLDDEDDDKEPWVKEIFDVFRKEFPKESELNCYVSW